MVALVALLASCASAPPPRPPRPRLVPKVVDSGWPRQEVMTLAMQAYRCAQREGQIERPRLTVIDYSLPSSQPRLWVIDLERKQVLHHELVAHGEGSGRAQAVAFSNNFGSHQSSLGLFRTENSYVGHYGYSLHLSGLEPGINDNARERAIVVHGFSKISRTVAAQAGPIANSWGCLAVPEETAAPIIDSIAGGSAIFAYYPDDVWLHSSRYLHCDYQLAESRPR